MLYVQRPNDLLILNPSLHARARVLGLDGTVWV